jgi:hypothetical protein
MRTRQSACILSLLLVLGLMITVSAGTLPPIHANIGVTTNSIQRLISSELRTYAGRLFRNPLDIDAGAAEFDLILGTPESNRLIREAVNSGRIALPDGKNADQGYAIKTVGKTICISWNSDTGVLYGLYELLGRYGVYFQISGEIVPPRTDFHAKQFNIRESPVFKYRGLLPWDNFLDGMSGYNYENYVELISRATQTSEDTQQWRALNLVGVQSIYPLIDGPPSINDGKWHRVTWDLCRLIKDKLGYTGTIKGIIIGSWEKPSEPITVELQDFTFGQRNTLN